MPLGFHRSVGLAPMKAPIIMIRLTPTQAIVLRNAKAGHVYRSERGHDLYASYDRALASRKRAHGQKTVTAVVNKLSTLGLLRIGELFECQRRWVITDLGEQVLSQTTS
jgi:hypothetical protein